MIHVHVGFNNLFASIASIDSIQSIDLGAHVDSRTKGRTAHTVGLVGSCVHL